VTRLFRLLDKKRGDRRTVTKWAGGIGEVVFFGVLLVLGLVTLTTLIATTVAQPDRYSLAIGFGYWLTMLVVIAIVLVGGTGTVWAILKLGTSVERRAAFAHDAARLDLSLDPTADEHKFPNIPHDEGLTNSPGMQFAYRLPPAQSPGWRLMAATTFAILWNGISCMLLILAARSFIIGEPQWFLAMIVLPFLGVGGWSLSYLIRQLWIHTAMGPTLLEISDHPILPGQTYKLLLSQVGHLHVRWIELWLICEEEATYSQGTDIRTEHARMYEAVLSRRENFLVEPSTPYHHECSFEVPADAMHSFQAEHHGVQWRLVVRGSVEGWPDFERGFPIIVHPGDVTRAARDDENMPQALKQTPRLKAQVPGAGVSA
jgi:hypothetical protein